MKENAGESELPKINHLYLLIDFELININYILDRKNFFESSHVHLSKTNFCHTEKSSRDSRVGIFFEKKSGDKFKPRRIPYLVFFGLPRRWLLLLSLG
jgi:hypothetical protein